MNLFQKQSRVNRRSFLEGMAVLGTVGVGNPANLLTLLTTNAPLQEKLPGRGEFIVRGAYVMTMDPTLGDLAGGDVHVRNGEIINLGKGLMVRDVEEIDGQDMIALPGLIETHWHMWNTLLRSMSGDEKKHGYFPTSENLGKVFTPEDMYQGVRLAAIEALFSGITTVHDWNHNIRGPAYADAALRALTDAGIRARFSYGYYQGQPYDEMIRLDDLACIQREWFTNPSYSLLTLGFASRGTECSPKVNRCEWEAARQMGLPISVHANSSSQWTGEIEYLYKERMLGKDIQVIHAISSTPAEIEMLAETGTSVSLSPYTEMRAGFGFPKTGKLLDAGVLVSLSVDTTALSGNADMFAVMKAIQNVENAIAENEFKLPPRRVLELATIDGAYALGIADRVGSLKPGKRADIILVSTKHINIGVFTDPAHLLVEAAQPVNVDTVIVDGRILKRRGQITVPDVNQVIHESNKSLTTVRQRANWW